MKVLIVAFSFPPSNVIGAVRVGKLARYLDRHGYELRVLTTDVTKDRSLPLDIPREWVVYTDYRAAKDWLDLLNKRFGRRPVASIGMGDEASQVRNRALDKSHWDQLRHQYYGLSHIPDQNINWLGTAIRAGGRLITGWKPDLIFASAPPFTGLVVASRLSRAFNIPWVADFRDLWADNPYYSFPAWRRPIDRIHESFTVRNVSAIVTTSPNFAVTLRKVHNKRVKVVFNGYADEDYPQTSCNRQVTESLIIRYTGSIYQGFRDPSPLFAAIASLENQLREQIRVEFFVEPGADFDWLASKLGIENQVAVCPPVPYRTALKLQLEADVLLLLHWSDKRDEGTIPAKLFEYLYARRPILYIGYEHSVAAGIIKERGAGFVSNAPERIRDQLRVWVDDKRAGCLARLDPSVSHGLSRDEQFQKLEPMFTDILNKSRGATRA